MDNVFISINALEHKKNKWIDTRFSLQDNEAGRRKYEESHVRDAIYWDLEKELSDMSIQAGRHPLPSKKDLNELFRKSGLELDDSIIIYDDGGSPFAARAWWILQYAGFSDAKIMLEGFEVLKDSGIEIDHNEPIITPSTVIPVWQDNIYSNREKVIEIVEGNAPGKLLDARSAIRYRGEQEPIDPIAGRIPTALNFDWEQLKQGQRFNMDKSVKNELIKIVTPDEPVTVYCGSGVTAAPLFAMLAHHGFSDVRLYVGSYSDWIAQKGAKTEKD